MLILRRLTLLVSPGWQKSRIFFLNFLLIPGLTESPTTYNVKCLHESDQKIIYRASFFTSEVDKVNIAILLHFFLNLIWTFSEREQFMD